jgi:protein phosphatase
MAQTPAISLAFAAATDIGCVRANNEDSFGYDVEQHLYVVCDGMGGMAGGEVASSLAVRVLIESFEAQSVQAEINQVELPIEERLARSIHEVNRVVREAAANDSQLQSMGTTLVCACLGGNRIVLGNVGDSRAYLVRNHVCSQITLDHSLLAEQIRNGVLTPEMAAASNLQSVITRAIGAANTVEPDFFAAELKPDDMLLLTSDGLTRYLLSEEIAAIAQLRADLPSVCQALIDLAKQRGGVDNITCIMLRAVELQLEQPSATGATDHTSTVAPITNDIVRASIYS